MANRTALKVGAVVVGAAVLFLVVRMLLGWLFRLAMLFGLVLLVAGLAYVAYRVWIASDESEDATTADAGRERTETGIGDDLDAVSDDDASIDAGLSDAEFERELEELREDS